jgi:hypothetical protein
MPMEHLMIVTVGPVDSAAALLWTTHTQRNLRHVRSVAKILPFQLPLDVADEFERLLQEWKALAEQSDTFRWTADLEREWARRLVQYWANLDSLTDEEAARIGFEWSPPEARPFFAALAGGVAWAFVEDDTAEPFSEFLSTRADEPTAGSQAANGS